MSNQNNCNMKMIIFTLFILLSIPLQMAAQHSVEYTQTKATITNVESKVSGKRPRIVVQVRYVIASGDTINSQLQLNGIPFLESSKEVGDTLTILYQKDNPYLFKTKSQSFFQRYGLYFIIAIVLLFLGYQLIKRKNGA